MRMRFNPVEFFSNILHSNVTDLEKHALQLFRHQATANSIYAAYLEQIGCNVSSVTGINQVPFLPVSFFKQQEVVSGSFDPEAVFTSSTTTGTIPARHQVEHKSIYEESYMNAFQNFYGDPEQYIFLALLPSYLEREGSSLVVMADGLIKSSNHELSGFYLDDFEKLASVILKAQQTGRKVFLLGVTFALLDFADAYPIAMQDGIVMETGGMKGRKQEMIREEVHEKLSHAFKIEKIHSEYGMTELLSQAYAKKDGRFHAPPWMKIVITDANDPFKVLPNEKTGVINVIDLANLSSCAFIQTSDIGRKHEDGSFEVLGRLDNSDIRGCSLMYL